MKNDRKYPNVRSGLAIKWLEEHGATSPPRARFYKICFPLTSKLRIVNLDDKLKLIRMGWDDSSGLFVYLDTYYFSGWWNANRV